METEFGIGQGFALETALAACLQLSRAVTRPVRRESDLLAGRAEVALMRDAARATLTHAAMQNVGTLVSACDSLKQVAPEGVAHYEALLKAYAAGAAAAIARFQ
ncbi:phosphoenolpyruvate carboxylase [Buchananella hordeovulneris]|uniref:phosphoenolpyruvate carboxylase n=1 Tax=Buchananella hordeovulneris TaxID=52770 RepID=UPI000F5F06F1|nr:phosphoenolpyruvate carboxylase [Buchananella hordeovulneris]RRD51561.1 phosphoenolpyruvate carboxylase [Buchananella hordeovulneris]